MESLSDAEFGKNFVAHVTQHVDKGQPEEDVLNNIDDKFSSFLLRPETVSEEV